LDDLTESNHVFLHSAVPYSPVFSTAETTFFVSASVGTFYAIDTTTGDFLWTVSSVVPASASPLVSPEDTFVYLTRVSSPRNERWKSKDNTPKKMMNQHFFL
jgi:outer membrane protein assembly factor BamB